MWAHNCLHTFKKCGNNELWSWISIKDKMILFMSLIPRSNKWKVWLSSSNKNSFAFIWPASSSMFLIDRKIWSWLGRFTSYPAYVFFKLLDPVIPITPITWHPVSSHYSTQYQANHVTASMGTPGISRRQNFKTGYVVKMAKYAKCQES